MAKRIQYKFIYTSQRVAKPGRLQSIDARQFRTDHEYTIEREGDTVYVSKGGHTVEIPWVHIISAVRTDDAPTPKKKPQPKAPSNTNPQPTASIKL